MSAPHVSVMVRSVESQFQDCLKVSDEAFFEKQNVAKRIDAIKSKIALMGNKFELFYRLKIPASQISDADFKELDSSGKTTFLAGYLGQLKKDELIEFFRPKPKQTLSKL